jgi:hypothetical protein
MWCAHTGHETRAGVEMPDAGQVEDHAARTVWGAGAGPVPAENPHRFGFGFRDFADKVVMVP